MTEKQQNLFKLLKEIDEICKKHNLRYVMAGGSLIGVVRNEGFIPWDDDIDIYMPKADWDKLVEISGQELLPDRALQCLEVDRNYTNTFPRYASTDTCVVHRHQIIGKDKAGEIIDVLTLDPIPADDREYEKYRTHLMIYSDLINIAVVYGNRYDVPVHLYIRYLLSYLFLGRDRTLKKLEKIMFSYKEEDCDRYAMRWGGCPFLFDKDMMFPLKYRKFEGLDVMVPNKISDYLIWHYGDEWSYIPPHGERESHDAVECEGINYEEFRKEYMPKLDTFRLRADAVKRKIYYMATSKRSHRLMNKRQRLLAEFTALDLKKRIEQNDHTLTELLENRNFKALNEIFGEYFRVQLCADFIGREDFVHIYSFYHPTLIEIEEDSFCAAMLTLLYTERISKAYRMLQVREKLLQLTPQMKKIKEDIELFRNAACCYEFHEMEKAEKTADELLGRYPQNPSFMKFKIRFVVEKAKKEGKAELAETFLSECLGLFPDDGYFMKFNGDILWMRGKCRDALEVYAQAREKTNNGITQLELDKFLQEYRIPAMHTCQSLAENGESEEAEKLSELWIRLLPEDNLVKGYDYLIKVTKSQPPEKIEELLEEMKGIIPDKPSDIRDVYSMAMNRAWECLGYSQELSELCTKSVLTDTIDELELLESKARHICHCNQDPYSHKVLGDILLKQGRTAEAFESYFKAVKNLKMTGDEAYIKTELAMIILDDFNKGSKAVAIAAPKTDASRLLDSWLNKYGSLDNIREIITGII